MPFVIADPSLKLKIFPTPGEVYRTYTFPGFDTITITGSSVMAISKDDGYHRLFDGTKGHMIPPSWIHLEWEVEDGGTIFRF